MNIAHLLLGSAREFSTLPALARGASVHLSYRELWRKVSVMSMHLTGRFGLRRGDRVAFAMTNCVEAIEVMYAVWHAGLCAVPMNAKLHAKEFAYILENSGARLCFVTPDLAAAIPSAIPVEEKLLLESGNGPCDVGPDDPAWLFYTSGTTGVPKGAVLTHRNLLFQTQAYFADIDRLLPTDSALHPAPLSHGSG